MDDSLSAVDAKTEEAILEGIKTNRQDKTTIISAHRISSVMHADEIIVLDNGEIIERGTHYELLEQNANNHLDNISYNYYGTKKLQRFFKTN